MKINVSILNKSGTPCGFFDDDETWELTSKQYGIKSSVSITINE